MPDVAGWISRQPQVFMTNSTSGIWRNQQNGKQNAVRNAAPGRKCKEMSNYRVEGAIYALTG